MLVLLQAGEDPRYVDAILIAFGLAVIDGILAVAFYALVFGALFLKHGFSDISRLAWRFLLGWAVCSAAVWIMEGTHTEYGWAALLAMVYAFLHTAGHSLGKP